MISKVACRRACQLMMVLAMSLVILLLSPLHKPAQAQTKNAPASLQVVLLIDRSGSAQSEDVSMPRVRFARILVDALRAQSWVSGAEIDLAIADFGGTVQLRRPMTRLGDEKVEIPLKLAEPIQLTDFRQPLREARDLFTPGGDHKRIVIDLTDGIPQLEERLSLANSTLPIPVYFGTSESAPSDSVRTAVSALSAIGAETFLVVDNASDDSTKVYSPTWAKVLPRNHYLSTGQPEPRFAAVRTLFETIAGGRIGLQRLRAGEMFSLSVSSTYRALGILSIQTSPEAGFEVSSPEGERFSPTFGSLQDRYAFYFVRSPSQGKWRLAAHGDVSEFYVWTGPQVHIASSPPQVEDTAPVERSINPLPLLAVVAFGLVITTSGLWVSSLRRKLLVTRGVITRLEEELERERTKEKTPRMPSDTREEGDKGDEERERLLEEYQSIVALAYQGGELIALKTSKLYGNIRRLPREDQWSFILQELIFEQQSQDLPREKIHVMVRVNTLVLWQRWRDQAFPIEELYKEFYGLLVVPTADWLIEELSRYSSLSEPESRSYLIWQMAEQRKRLNGFADEKTTPETLGSCAKFYASRNPALEEFYRLMRKISEGKPLSDSEAVGKLEEYLPRPLSMLSQLARRAFRIRRASEMETHLQFLADQIDAEEHWRLLPEVRLLMLKREDWLKFFENCERGHFSPRIAPSLKLNVVEERGTETELALAFHYEGKALAFDVCLFYRGEGGLKVHAKVVEQEKVRNGETYIRIDDGVPDGAISLGRLVLRGAGVLRYWLEYTSYLPESTSLADGDFEFKTEAKSESSPAALVDQLNPFSPDGPIHADRYWQTLVRGDHSLIVARICAELRGTPRPLAIRGLRRSGKTTALLRLPQVLGERSGFQAVHIEIREWASEFEDLKDPIREDGLRYEIAAAAVRSADLPDSARSKEIVCQFEPDMAMSLDSFAEFTRKFREETGLKPLFLIDDLDFWLNRRAFSDDTWKLLRHLGDLAEQGVCSVVVAYTWTGEEWEKRLRAHIIASIHPIEMLQYQDVVELLDLVPAVKTQMARELIWRLTGGWQGLLQLMLYRIYEEFLRSGRRDVPLVKFVAGELINSADWRPLLKYLVESLQRKEAMALQRLIERQLVDPDTSEIRELYFSPSNHSFGDSGAGEGDDSFVTELGSLKAKGIIEPFSPDNGKLRLRVGFLSYPPVCDLLTTSA